jgi:hypothetical protein
MPFFPVLTGLLGLFVFLDKGFLGDLFPHRDTGLANQLHILSLTD